MSLVKVFVSSVVLLVLFTAVYPLDNGLARTPPMGWMSGQRFRCNVDCKNYPDDCISETLVKSTADTLVKRGYMKAGYKYVAVDDCWLAMKRDKSGNIQPDPLRFPSGIKALADYVHAKGLKLGLYLSAGNLTCMGYPGSLGHYDSDMATLASWGVDMLKLDWCNSDPNKLNTEYEAAGRALNKTGRPILYTTTWPLGQKTTGIQPNLTLVAKYCNTYRVYKDLEDGWESLEALVKYYGDNGRSFVQDSGPGNWNDPDQLLVGDFGLSTDQQKMQMALWCIMSAPLFVSADVRRMRPESQAILLNPRAIAINQDPLGIMGVQIVVKGQVKIWKKAITPKGSFALVLVYTNISGGPSRVSVLLSDIGFTTAAAYNFTDVFEGTHIGVYKPWHTFNCEVDPTGVLFIQAAALP